MRVPDEAPPASGTASAARRVVVVAGSVEGIDALARLINGLPSTFPVPVVAHVRGLRNASMTRLVRNKLYFPATPEVVFARDGEPVRAGGFYVAPAGREPIFTDTGILGIVRAGPHAGADRLFESAAFRYGAGTVGVVLSGLGDDGTRGLLAITEVHGTRVVQSPSEASFTAMPANALLGDHIQHAVVLDRLGVLLRELVEAPPTGGAAARGRT